MNKMRHEETEQGEAIQLSSTAHTNGKYSGEWYEERGNMRWKKSLRVIIIIMFPHSFLFFQ
jgi:hypothetical protein